MCSCRARLYCEEARRQETRLVLFIERLIRSAFINGNKLGIKRFYDPHDIPISIELEKNFPAIKAEYNEIIKRYKDFAPFQTISPHQTYISNDDKWRLFFLRGAGIWFKRNCALMPLTSSIIKKHSSSIVSAYISVLGPRKSLNPHAGPYSGVLRLHLAIDIPDPIRCWINVGGERGFWREGKLLMFDDTYEHTAHNDTDDLRSVLFMDVLRPLPFHLDLINRMIVKVSRIFPYVFIPWRRHKGWEKSFYM